MVSNTKIDWRHVEEGDVSSTNDYCLQHARNGAASGLWITAERQLGGRGRRGRQWVSEKGNLYASLLLNNPARNENIGTLPLVAALAANFAIRKVLPVSMARSQIKWPNDILIDGAKVCGILLESEVNSQDQLSIVIGIGINISHHPDQALYRTTSLNALGLSISPQDLFAHLFEAMKYVLALWDEGRGLAAIRDLWLENAAGIDEDIKINLPNEVLYGRFIGLSEDCNLILRQEDGDEIKIAAGDVFLLDR
ncbi:MAG: biotin--[acetyl-CoA-carboxylase] ligase [Rhizobiaceae bacterium]|nr:biotin--[acetyl-CoA-carboxylase] ligase [Rhizobiaceae bacterium]